MRDPHSDPTLPPKNAPRATTTPTLSALGRVLDARYRIEQPLAAGGMGSVYRGRQLNLSREVAIKMVLPEDANDAERFRREAEALAAVSHPAIVEVHDFVADPGATAQYLVMAFVDGVDLSAHLAQQPGAVLQMLEAVDLMLPVASALVELHSRGILHRDLKPANLVRFVRADGRAGVKLVDFGIARRDMDPGLTAEGLVVGTPSYLSPEVMLGKKHSPASDVWAYGATLFELLVGSPPFGNDEVHAIMRRTVHESVRIPHSLLGSPVEPVLLSALDRDEARRPNVRQLLEALEAVRLTLASGGVVPLPQTRSPALASPALLPTGLSTCALPSRPCGPPTHEGHEGEPAGPAAPQGAPPQGAPPQGAPPGGAKQVTPTRQVAPLPSPGTMGSAKPGPPARSSRGALGLAYGVAAVSVFLALGVTLYFTALTPRGKAGDEKPAELELGRDVTEASAREDPTAGDPAMAPEPRKAPPVRERPPEGRPPDDRLASPEPRRPSPTDGKLGPGPETAPIVAALGQYCASPSRAFALFREGTGLFKTKRQSPRAKAIFHVILTCPHSGYEQRFWSAQRLSNLYRISGDCPRARAAWAIYEALATQQNRPVRTFEPCP